MPRAIGIVAEQDFARMLARVRFPDRDQLKSWWLGVSTRGAQSDKDAWMPDVGEQVICLMDEDFEDGDILGARFSTVDAPPPGMQSGLRKLLMEDGTFVSYDRVTHVLTISLPAGGEINVSANGATIQIDSVGNLILTPGALVKLAGGGAAIARVGDQTTCPAGTGQITSGSVKAVCG